jgi:hypothetical protein
MGFIKLKYKKQLLRYLVKGKMFSMVLSFFLTATGVLFLAKKAVEISCYLYLVIPQKVPYHIQISLHKRVAIQELLTKHSMSAGHRFSAESIGLGRSFGLH